MKKFLALLAGAMLMGGVATSAALATIYSPNQSEILTYSLLHADNPLVQGFNLGDNLSGGVEFNAIMLPLGSHSAFAQFGKTYTNLDLSGYSEFSVIINNHNENPWDFRLLLRDNDTSTTISSATTNIIDGNFATLLLDFALNPGFNFAGVDEVLVEVSGSVPIITPGHVDRTAEFDITPTPEPGTMMLLGAGLLGLAIYGKRRKNA